MNNSKPLYGKLCSHFYDHQQGYASCEEVAFYASFLSSHDRNLEAMSGSGRLQIPLLQLGYAVDGIDASNNMLNRCRQRCAALHIDPLLYEQRLEELELAHTNYAAAFIAVGSFQLIFEKAVALQALQRLRAHMSHNAPLLIDIFTPPLATSPYPITKVAHIDANQEIHFSLRSHLNTQVQQIDAYCTYELFVNGIPTQEEHELMRFRWYSDKELAELLYQAGFSFITVHKKPFGPSGWSRIVEARAI